MSNIVSWYVHKISLTILRSGIVEAVPYIAAVPPFLFNSGFALILSTLSFKSWNNLNYFNKLL